MNHLHAHGSLTPVIARNDRWFQRLEVPIFYFFFFSFNFFNIWTLLTRIERSCCFVITIRCGRRKKWKRKPSLSLFLSLYLSIYLPLRYRVLLSLRNLWIYRFRRKRFPSLHSRSIVLTNLSFEIEFFVQLIFLSTDNERSFLLSFIFFLFPLRVFSFFFLFYPSMLISFYYLSFFDKRRVTSSTRKIEKK